MRILIATDAWHPQINGVVRTLTMMAAAAPRFGAEIVFLTPESFRTVALPGYEGLRVALPSPVKVARLIERAHPDNIHIATEGPIGLMVRRYCCRRDLPFTTSFHTRFPDYIAARAPVPEAWVWAALRRFHRPSQSVMAATPALAGELRARGFDHVMLWPRGVDTTLFHPRNVDFGLPRPVFLSVGRVAVEKNLEAFLSLDLPGTKVVVGDGPADCFAAEVSASGFPRRHDRRGLGQDLCRRRRLRVSKPDRYLRTRSSRSLGERRAGCSFPRSGASRCCRHRTGRSSRR